jgi:hypothetical protein
VNEIFCTILDGDSRDWFKDLPPRYIDGIVALDDLILRNWGDKKDLLYYVTKFKELTIE